MSTRLLPTNNIPQANRFPALFQPTSISKLTIGVALGALIAFVFYLSRQKKPIVRATNDENSIKSLLPKRESAKTIEEVKGGFSNTLWQVTTETKCYIFRSPKMKCDPSHFVELLKVCKYAFECQLSPQVINENVHEQQMLLEYIEHAPWPSYENNPEPYKATMKALRCFHEKMRPLVPKEIDPSYAPFFLVFEEGHRLEMNSDIPKHFSLALEKMRIIFKELQPWLKTHATLCHGDFHKGNVLLSKKKLTPVLIDFDSISAGHPFFDVVKFSIALPQHFRQELFSEYLGGHMPTQEEQRHFELMDLSLLMVITCVRFKLAKSSQNNSQSFLSKCDLEKILNSENALPSFLEIPFGNSSPKAKQLGAAYALAEFLKRTNLNT